jgi:hypothetical protein
MDQLHKRFTNEQVRVLPQGYCQGIISRSEIQELLGTGKTRLFALLEAYRRDPSAFSLAYQRATPPRLSPEVETAIATELLREKVLIEDPRLPITDYNYSALSLQDPVGRDRLHKQGIQVSLTTIINRAKQLGCYQPQKPRKIHDREVLTAAIGALIQHDASLHLWSPCACIRILRDAQHPKERRSGT